MITRSLSVNRLPRARCRPRRRLRGPAGRLLRAAGIRGLLGRRAVHALFRARQRRAGGRRGRQPGRLISGRSRSGPTRDIVLELGKSGSAVLDGRRLLTLNRAFAATRARVRVILPRGRDPQALSNARLSVVRYDLIGRRVPADGASERAHDAAAAAKVQQRRERRGDGGAQARADRAGRAQGQASARRRCSGTARARSSPFPSTSAGAESMAQGTWSPTAA